MKESSTCPKCQSTDVTRIRPFKGTSTSSLVQLTKWGTVGGYFDRYVCLSCGFMEHYANLEEKGWQKWIDEQRKNNALESDFV